MTPRHPPRLIGSDSDEGLRPLLFSIAYRMVGTVTEAEDLVQETLLRVHSAEAEGTKIESRQAYACAVATRLCIDHLRSARVQREHYVGEWLPEPIVTDRALDPAEHAELSDSLSTAFLVLLETLSPAERAVLLLHDVFGYEYGEIAELIAKSEANCRQIAARARHRVEERKPRFEVSVEKRWQLAEQFFAAVRNGDTDGLAKLLAEDVTLYGDGGGKAPAIQAPLRGASAVAQFLAGIGRQGRADQVSVDLVEVNGQPGAVVQDSAGSVVAVATIDVAEGKVQAVWSVVNPDKLSHVHDRTHGRDLRLN